ncbi:MAG: hypothetical protein KAU48_10355 [Candidatus Thorarchaeota archaeon]|nr:hypothetical protein [Candidatus Thorarchaeota archaeon]
MDEESKQEILRVLNKELSRQQGIFNKHAPIAINPNAKGYDEVKAAFNKADWAIKDLYKQIAYLKTEETYEPSIIDKIKEVVDKLTGDDDPGVSTTTGVRG